MLSGLKARLRTLKPFWVLYNLLNWRSLRHNAELYRQAGIERSVVAPIAHRDIARPSEEVPWLDRPDARERLQGDAGVEELPTAARGKLETWIDDGYMVLQGFFDRQRVDAVNREVERLLDEGDVAFHFDSPRITDAYRRSPRIAEALCDPELAKVLRFLLGRRVRLFQTLNFLQGTEQPAHSDSFHMTTEPRGFLVGAWVALEDIDPDAGPVFYYPASHRLPYVMTEDLGIENGGLVTPDKDPAYYEKIERLVADSGLEPVEFTASAGDVLVWHANLLHGGRPVRRAAASRRSMVAHYFAADVLCYHEVSERPAIQRGPILSAA
jgi:ectoine hydroxylase